MKLIIWLAIIYDIVISLNMDALITCFEQNDEKPSGFTDKVYSDLNTTECLARPDLCYNYLNVGYHPGKGDVCDHTDPKTGNVRNTCYFNTIYGEEENEEKTWSYKCFDLENCPVKDEYGGGMAVCQVTDKRINCCCNDDDFCNGSPLIVQFAQWGRADHFPPNYTEICSYDYGETLVLWTVPGYEDCGNFVAPVPLTTQEGEQHSSTQTTKGHQSTTKYPQKTTDTNTYTKVTPSPIPIQEGYLPEDLGTENVEDSYEYTAAVCVIKEIEYTECAAGPETMGYQFTYVAVSQRNCGDGTELTYSPSECSTTYAVAEVDEEISCMVTECDIGYFKMYEDGSLGFKPFFLAVVVGVISVLYFV